MGRALYFLQRQLLPHAEAEESALYPVVDSLLGEGATQTMRLDHAEIARLTADLAGLKPRLREGALTPADQDELRRLLYGLYALVRLHFHKEEDAYLPLLDERLDAGRAAAMFEAMERAAGQAKARQERS